MSSQRWRESKPCQACGFARKVIHWRWGEDRIYWAKLCGACEMLQRAEDLRRQAALFEARGLAVLAKRKARSRP